MHQAMVFQVNFRPMVHTFAVFLHPKQVCKHLQQSVGELRLTMNAAFAHGQAALVRGFRQGTAMPQKTHTHTHTCNCDGTRRRLLLETHHANPRQLLNNCDSTPLESTAPTQPS